MGLNSISGAAPGQPPTLEYCKNLDFCQQSNVFCKFRAPWLLTVALLGFLTRSELKDLLSQVQEGLTVALLGF